MSTEQGELLRGVLVRPRNVSANMTGSIHEERTATALGMRGALVTGRTLLVAFAPLLVKAFGERWFEQGSVSVAFRDGVLDQEEIRAVLRVPTMSAEDVQVEAWLERPAGAIVARGTAAVGRPTEPTWLGAIDPAAYDGGDYQIVGELAIGTRFPDAEVVVTQAQAERWAAALPSLDWFSGRSPWGGSIASAAVLSTALASGCTLYRRAQPILGVPVDGAIELRNINGPLLLDRPYRITSGVIGRGASPRTEYIWYESAADDATGRRICAMRMQLRFMKGSSALVAPVSSPSA